MFFQYFDWTKTTHLFLLLEETHWMKQWKDKKDSGGIHEENNEDDKGK